MSQQTSLLSFFSPKQPKNYADKIQTPLRSDTPVNFAKSKKREDVPSTACDDEKENFLKKRKGGSGSIKKRKRIRLLDDSSDDDYKPPLVLSDDDADMTDDIDEVDEIARPLKKTPHTPNTPTLDSSTRSSLASFHANTEFAVDNSAISSRVWKHQTLDWIKPDKIKDSKGRPTTDPNYDQGTLHIPRSFLDQCTPGHRQWWTFKIDYFDVVIFFKVGKFYEFYHMDADIGVSELNLTYMKGDYAHCGFPEAAYSRYADSLVQRGYKVARVEQTETPDMMNVRLKETSRTTKFDKVVKREICKITTKGTRTFSFIDGCTLDDDSSYLLAIADSPSQFGVCFVDTTIGKFYLSQFTDDRHCSRLRTVLAQHPPGQVLYPKCRLDPRTWSVLSSQTSSALKEPLIPGSQFWDANTTVKHLIGLYGSSDLPDVLQTCVDDQTKNELCISALGAVIYYLRKCICADDLLSQKSFELYSPIPTDVTKKVDKFWMTNSHMVLDGVTLENLEILPNGSGMSLLERLDHCNTAFGRRLLRQWVCSPLTHPTAILRRQEALEELTAEKGTVEAVVAILKKLPDLERLLRVLIANMPLINSRHFIQDEGGIFPNISEELSFLTSAYDKDDALEKGEVLPKCGVNIPYDLVANDIEEMEVELKEYLEGEIKRIGCRSMVYFGRDRNRYQLEVPDNVPNIPSNYTLKSQRKGYKRYTTLFTENMLTKMQGAEDKREAALKDTLRGLFAAFDGGYEKWQKALTCVAILDVLISLSVYSQSESEMSFPQILADVEKPFIQIKDGRHPLVDRTFSGSDFIPNDHLIGSEQWNSCVLVTGPNMGGKSTLMRQVGLLATLAQLGSKIPAASCRMSPIDRIFTRLGASDRITAGESTFFVELSETSVILQHATEHSLVLVDELGRGTATYDGMSLACAVVDHLARATCCRTLFSTHYHWLVDCFSKDDGISLGHMACMVETDEEDVGEEIVTFLYKFIEGACPKSYGFNVARLANVPAQVIDMGRKKAAEFEQLSKNKRMFWNMLVAKNIQDVRCLLSK